MCMSVFIFYIVCFCLGIQCGQQRKNFIEQGNLFFLTVHMTINALNLESYASFIVIIKVRTCNM